MREVKDIGDLRPAPRTAPAVVLWALALVAAGGVLLLALGQPQGPGMEDEVSLPRAQPAEAHRTASADAASAAIASASTRP